MRGVQVAGEPDDRQRVRLLFLGLNVDYRPTSPPSPVHRPKRGSDSAGNVDQDCHYFSLNRIFRAACGLAEAWTLTCALTFVETSAKSWAKDANTQH